MMSMHIRHWKGKLSLAVEKIGEDFMRAEEKNMVERIMDTETMGYAYEYPYGGGARKNICWH